ncbi:MAG: twin-arginine translocation signal domain-containing protein [Microcoleus sp.]
MKPNRRQFLGAIGAAGVASAIVTTRTNSQTPTPSQPIASPNFYRSRTCR